MIDPVHELQDSRVTMRKVGRRIDLERRVGEDRVGEK